MVSAGEDPAGGAESAQPARGRRGGQHHHQAQVLRPIPIGRQLVTTAFPSLPIGLLAGHRPHPIIVAVTLFVFPCATSQCSRHQAQVLRPSHWSAVSEDRVSKPSYWSVGWP